jgi:hypothetical protein
MEKPERIRKYKPKKLKIKGSEYGKFHSENLGFNFKNLKTGKVLRKSQYYDKFGANEVQGWTRIPYVPIDGFDEVDKMSGKY